MILSVKYINKAFRGLVLFLALGFLVCQPLLQSNYFLKVPIFEMSENDVEDDTEEEDRQEDENTDKKNGSLVVQARNVLMDYAYTSSNTEEQEVCLQIDRDIHIPPPDHI